MLARLGVWQYLPSTYREKLKSKEEHQAGVAPAAHTAPIPTTAAKPSGASDRSLLSDRFLAPTAALNTFNGSWRIPAISVLVAPCICPVSLFGLCVETALFEKEREKEEESETDGRRREKERERGRQRADRMSLRFAFFDLLPARSRTRIGLRTLRLMSSISCRTSATSPAGIDPPG